MSSLLPNTCELILILFMLLLYQCNSGFKEANSEQNQSDLFLLRNNIKLLFLGSIILDY